MCVNLQLLTSLHYCHIKNISYSGTFEGVTLLIAIKEWSRQTEQSSRSSCRSSCEQHLHAVQCSVPAMGSKAGEAWVCGARGHLGKPPAGKDTGEEESKSQNGGVLGLDRWAKGRAHRDMEHAPLSGKPLNVHKCVTKQKRTNQLSVQRSKGQRVWGGRGFMSPKWSRTWSCDQIDFLPCSPAFVSLLPLRDDFGSQFFFHRVVVKIKLAGKGSALRNMPVPPWGLNHFQLLFVSLLSSLQIPSPTASVAAAGSSLLLAFQVWADLGLLSAHSSHLRTSTSGNNGQWNLKMLRWLNKLWKSQALVDM